MASVVVGQRFSLQATMPDSWADLIPRDASGDIVHDVAVAYMGSVAVRKVACQQPEPSWAFEYFLLAEKEWDKEEWPPEFFLRLVLAGRVDQLKRFTDFQVEWLRFNKNIPKAFWFALTWHVRKPSAKLAAMKVLETKKWYEEFYEFSWMKNKDWAALQDERVIAV